jgi:hypothetical protein
VPELVRARRRPSVASGSQRVHHVRCDLLAPPTLRPPGGRHLRW